MTEKSRRDFFFEVLDKNLECGDESQQAIINTVDHYCAMFHPDVEVISTQSANPRVIKGHEGKVKLRFGTTDELKGRPLIMTGLSESLAKLWHERWSEWLKRSLLSVNESKNGFFTISDFQVRQWRRVAHTDYDDLTGDERENAAKEAREIVHLLVRCGLLRRIQSLIDHDW